MWKIIFWTVCISATIWTKSREMIYWTNTERSCCEKHLKGENDNLASLIHVAFLFLHVWLAGHSVCDSIWMLFDWSCNGLSKWVILLLCDCGPQLGRAWGQSSFVVQVVFKLHACADFHTPFILLCPFICPCICYSCSTTWYAKCLLFPAPR